MGLAGEAEAEAVLDQHLRREGRRQHDEILYRRLALLQQEAPTAAVMRAAPAAEATPGAKKVVDKHLALRMPEHPPRRRQKGGACSSDASTLKRSLETNRRKQKALERATAESLSLLSDEFGIPPPMPRSGSQDASMPPLSPEDGTAYGATTLGTLHTARSDPLPQAALSPRLPPTAHTARPRTGAARTRSPQQGIGVLPLPMSPPSPAAAADPGSMYEGFRALPMSPQQCPESPLNRLCAPPLGLSPRNAKAETRQAVFHRELLKEKKTAKASEFLGGVEEQEVGFAELFAAIAKTIGAIQQRGNRTVSTAFTLLSAHIKSLLVDEEASRLVGILEPFMADAEASPDAGARFAVMLLDHVFCLLDSVNPRLRELIAWARERLCGAAYCSKENLHEQDFGKDADDPDRLFFGECAEWEMRGPKVFLGPPPLPLKSMAYTLLDLRDPERERECVTAALGKYSGRLNVEDNRIQQAAAEKHHLLIVNKQRLADRMIAAESAVATYWQRSTGDRLFRAWRKVVKDRKDSEKHAAQVVRLTETVAMLEAKIVHLNTDRSRVEAAYEDQLKKMEMKVSELSRALEMKTQEYVELTDRSHAQAKQILQHQADEVLMKERCKKLIRQVEGREEEIESLKLTLQQTTHERDALRVTETNHHALMKTCTGVLGELQFGPAVAAYPTAEDPPRPGVLKHFTATFLGPSVFPSSKLCDHLAEGVGRVFPDTDDFVQAVSRVDGAPAKAGALFDLLRRVLGDVVPVSARAFLPPIQSSVVPETVGLLAAKAAQPLPANGGFNPGGATSDMIAHLEALVGNVRRALSITYAVAEDVMRYPKASTYFGPCLAPAARPALFTPNAGKFQSQRLGLMQRTGKLDPVKRRVLNYAAEMEYLMEAYKSVYLVTPGVKEMMDDSKLPKEVVAEVMGCMPPTARDEVTPDIFSAALICGACRMLPRVPPEEAFEMFLQQHLMKNCKVHRRREGTDAHILFHEYAAQLQLVYAQISAIGAHRLSDNAVTVAKAAKFFHSIHLLAADDDDTAADGALTMAGFTQLHERLYRADVGRLPAQDADLPEHQFHALLVLVAQVKYPSQALTDYERLRLLLEKYVFPAANS